MANIQGVKPAASMATAADTAPRPVASPIPTQLERVRARGRLRGTLAILGPAFVACVAYVDPGNFATNIAGGAKYGYLLLWVLLAANLMAMLIQNLSAKIGIATGRNLPELCREQFPRPVTWGLWVQAELIAMATDLAEFIGAAIALNLLFGIPMFHAGLITAVVAFAILGLQPQEQRRAPPELLPRHLGQVSARRNPELRRKRLDQHREQVGRDDHPHQLVAELRAACDVRREVAGVDIRDAGDERRPEERQDPEARAVEGLVDGTEALGQSLLPSGDHAESLAGPKSLPDETEVGQAPVALLQLEPVADEELVGDREADVPYGQVVDEAAVRALEQGRDVQRGRIADRERPS